MKARVIVSLSSACTSLVLLGLLAINLRPALTGIGPLIGQIRQETGISVFTASLLTSLPLVVLGVFAPLGHLGRRYGLERTVVLALGLLVLGLLMRSHGSVWALLAGSLCLAAGIAIGNVLAPGVIKRDFPGDVQAATMAYAVTMGIAGAIAAGLAVPLSSTLPGGWRSALAIWALPATIAFLVWLSRSSRINSPVTDQPAIGSVYLWRSGLAWTVAVFMGLQSGQFYVVVVWYPTILQVSGYGAVESGWLIALYQTMALATSLLVPVALKRTGNQSGLSLLGSLLVSCTILGLALFPQWGYLWMMLMGVGGGICLVLSLIFLSARVSSHQQAVALAVMSQLVGFLLAAAAPFLLGLAYAYLNDWFVPLVVFACIGGLQAVVGYEAGRDRVLT